MVFLRSSGIYVGLLRSRCSLQRSETPDSRPVGGFRGNWRTGRATSELPGPWLRGFEGGRFGASVSVPAFPARRSSPFPVSETLSGNWLPTSAVQFRRPPAPRIPVAGSSGRGRHGGRAAEFAPGKLALPPASGLATVELRKAGSALPLAARVPPAPRGTSWGGARASFAGIAYFESQSAGGFACQGAAAPQKRFTCSWELNSVCSSA